MLRHTAGVHRRYGRGDSEGTRLCVPPNLLARAQASLIRTRRPRRPRLPRSFRAAPGPRQCMRPGECLCPRRIQHGMRREQAGRIRLRCWSRCICRWRASSSLCTLHSPNPRLPNFWPRSSPACISVLCSQLDSIRRQIAAQFPGIERELEALDHGALPGTVGHESSARERPELNPSAHRYASTKEHTLRWAFENSQSLFTLLAFCAATRRAAVGA